MKGFDKMLSNKIIVIDPGHSGRPDPGVVSCDGYEEASIAWKIACIVQDILMSRWNAKVTLTKQSEFDPTSDSLFSRYTIANDIGADCFVSIHLNGAEQTQANGTETFHSHGSKLGSLLATQIQKQLIACLGLTDRGIKQANFAVLRYTDMPAVLTEVCFLSNLQDTSFITKPHNVTKAAEAIAQGIVDYFYYIDKGE